MRISQALSRLTKLGFTVGHVPHASHWGKKDVEPEFFQRKGIEQFHVIKGKHEPELHRDVYIGKCKNGWYVTSSIVFTRKNFACRNSFLCKMMNVYGGGKTLQSAMDIFEDNLLHRNYNGQ